MTYPEYVEWLIHFRLESEGGTGSSWQRQMQAMKLLSALQQVKGSDGRS